MCGIIGYAGKEKAAPILIDGLKRLEYRGYDSAGLVVFDGRRPLVSFARARGKVNELENKISKNWAGNTGIAHTRWATHGEPSERNAHPHFDCNKSIFVCHNGIIENYKDLKDALISRGHRFNSDTDTEVLAHLIEENLRYGKHCRLVDAVAAALKSVRGTYGLAIMAVKWPDRIIAARNSSPLVIGIGKNGNIVASDASAIISKTREAVYLNDNELAEITEAGVRIFDLLSDFKSLPAGLSAENTKSKKKLSKDKNNFTGNRFFPIAQTGFPKIADESNGMSRRNAMSQRSVASQKNVILRQRKSFEVVDGFDASLRKETLNLEIADIQKSGFLHFMLKEIFEQPDSIANTLAGRIIPKEGLVKLGGLENVTDRLNRINRIVITGCGTAYLAGLVGKLMIEEYAGIPCEAELASELRYRDLAHDSRNLAMVAVSQSGETADTLAALRKFKEKGALTLGIVNVVGSTIARETDAGVYNHAGPEIGVASTKAFTSQLAVFALLALLLSRKRGMPKATGKKIAKEIQKIPELVREVLKQDNKVKEIAGKYKNYGNFLYIGRKYNFPVACEGALKLKEISYIHAEGYSAGEMKHGPIAMIDENFPTVAIAPVDGVYEKMISNMEEIKARRGRIIALTDEGNEKIKSIADDYLCIPKTLDFLTPMLSVILLQLLAYHIGTLKGLDVDRPRNLAKSVTVE